MKIPAQRQRVILYYPRVLITPGPWLKQALLYWDSIGSIVPQNLERLIYNDRWMRELTDEGVFHSFRPEEVFNQNPDLDSALFIELQETITDQTFQRYLNYSRGHPQYFEIYQEKIPDQISTWLDREGFATRLDFGQWRFERHVGLLYMALLAKYMADVSQFTTIPGTDFGLYKDLIFKAKGESEHRLGLAIRLKDVLPVPKRSVTITQILQFKRKRQEELFTLREEIDNFETALKNIQEFAEARDITTRFSERMIGRVNNLCKVFDDARLPYALGTLENLINVGTLPILGLFSDRVQIPIGVQIGGAAGLGVITVSKYLLDHRNDGRRILSENPFSYLYLAQRQGIIR
jgi:hypothetical protein